MKLSEISTDKAVDILCEIVPYITSIASDEHLLEELKRKVKLPEGATAVDTMRIGAEKINKIVPLILKEKRSDIYGILAAVNNMTVDEVAKQNLLKTAKQIAELVNDKDFIDFFKSCGRSEGSE